MCLVRERHTPPGAKESGRPQMNFAGAKETGTSRKPEWWHATILNHVAKETRASTRPSISSSGLRQRGARVTTRNPNRDNSRIAASIESRS
jgi:hypothetical protein